MQGSLENRLYEGNQYGDLVVGMGATEMAYSDRHAYTVQKVISDNRVIVTKDEVKRTDSNGMSDCQKYEYIPTDLVETEAEFRCCNPFAHIVDTDDFDCGVTCEACEHFKKRKRTNGIELRRCKKGWKKVGTDTYFTLGMKEEYFDFSF